MLFGEVVELYGVECGFGDFFGAVLDGGDGCLADEAGEASDAAGGALVEVGVVAGEGAGAVVLEVEGVFEVGDDVGEGVGLAVAGGEGAAGDEGGASGELGAAYAAEQGCGGDVDAGVDECRCDSFGEVFQQVGCLGAGSGAGVEAVDFVDEDQADAGGVVGVADRVGDLGLGHPGGRGDAEVAGELGGECLCGRAGRDEDVGDRDLGMG